MDQAARLGRGTGARVRLLGFLVLFARTSILAFQDDVARPILGFDFWHGPFYLGYYGPSYLGYSLLLDTCFATWMSGQTGTSAPFKPDADPGSYSFRARLRQSADGTHSGYSPAKSILVG